MRTRWLNCSTTVSLICLRKRLRSIPLYMDFYHSNILTTFTPMQRLLSQRQRMARRLRKSFSTGPLVGLIGKNQASTLVFNCVNVLGKILVSVVSCWVPMVYLLGAI